MIEQRLAESEELAKALVMSKVVVNDQRAVKAGDMISQDARVRIKVVAVSSHEVEKVTETLKDFVSM